MNDKTSKVINDLDTSIRVGEFELFDILQNVPPMILRIENGFEELKAVVSEYEFPSSE